MNSRDIRSFSLESGAGSFGKVREKRRWVRWFTQRVGRALGTGRATHHVESLETRQLLEGSFLAPLALPAANGAGVISSPQLINPAQPSTNNDTFTWTAATSGFVSVLADTSNEATFNLNTAVRVYNSQQQLIASGADNGTLTSGLQPDGWAGFVAEAGEQYFFQVSSETSASGSYNLRVHTTNAAFSIGQDGPPSNGIATQVGLDPGLARAVVGQLGGTGAINTRLRQDEIIYRWDVDSDDVWDGLVTINAQSTQTNLNNRLDTRIEVYDASGQIVTSNSDTGHLNDAFVALRAHPDDTFYIRVRSDQVLNRVTPSQNQFNLQKATGPFFLVMDAIATPVALNRVTRRGGVPGGALDAFNQSAPPPSPTMGAPVFDTSLFEFEVVGNGRAFVSVTPTGLDPIADPAVRIYNSQGVQVGYNDNFAGLNAQVEVQLIGGDRYFIVVDNFQERAGTQFALWIETQHTFDAGVDDHGSTAELDQATPLVFNDPFLTFDSDNNPVRDRGLRQSASSGGRLYQAGDRDVYMFTPPVDMLQNFTGNDDDQGTSLYIGGAFSNADLNTAFPVNSRNLTIWDAADYWYTGRQDFDPDFGVFYGFNDNPDTATPRAEIYAMHSWDDDNNAQTPRVLVVGGDFDLIIPGLFGPVTMKNLAVWRFNAAAGKYQWSNELGDTDGAVRCFAEYSGAAFDPDGSEPLAQINDSDGTVPLLYMGGSFTTVDGTPAVALARRNGGWEAVAAAGALPGVPGAREFSAVTAGEVYALAVYNAPDSGDTRAADPGPPALLKVPDPPDLPLALYIGGKFTLDADQNALALWNGAYFGYASSGSSPVVPPTAPTLPNPYIRKGAAIGTVYSLAVFTDPDPDGNGDDTEQEVLMIGGDFTSVSGITANNFAQWGRIDITQDPALANYTPKLLWEAPFDDLGTELNGPVRALTVWQPPRINLQANDPAPLVVLGGEFFGLNTGGPNLSDFVAGWDGLNPIFLGGFDAPVRTLAVTSDAQEPSIEDQLDSGVTDQQVLYAGGDFTQFTNNGATFFPASHVAQFSAVTGPNFPDDGFTWAALNGGVDYSDDTQGDAAVYALGIFDDGIAGQYDRHDKPATRVSISVSGIENSFINAVIRVFDSTGTLLFTNDTIAPPFPDPAGMVDASLAAPGRDTTLDGITVWGGETYYVEVGDLNDSGTGRYAISVTVDAGPVDWDGNGTKEDINAIAPTFEEPDEGDFANASRLVTPLATGDVELTVNSATPPPTFTGRNFVTKRANPSKGVSAQLGGDLGTINRLDDTDLYTFEAQYTGTVEIRVATLALADQFGQLDDDFRGINKTFNSRLDAALRVFRNDFTQIAYNDDFAGQRNEGVVLGTALGDQADVGSITGVFGNKDPRIVINVVAGDRYYIQVESAQRYKIGDRTLPPDGSDPDNPDRRVENTDSEIDRRDAIGAYNLIVNQLPRLNSGFKNGLPVQDDHPNFAQGLAQGSPVLINEDIGNSLNGRGTASGVIDNIPLQAADNDIFRFYAIGNGVMSIRLTFPSGSALNGRMFLLNPTNGAQLATSAAQNDGSALITFTVQQGQELVLYVEGQGGTQGAYNIAFALPPQRDDTADLYKWWNARDLNLLDFQGQGSIAGEIEKISDTDVYRVSFPFSESVTFTVTQQDTTLDPTVTVYEVMEDEVGRPYIKRVAFNDDISATDSNASVAWGLYPDRTVVPAAGPTRTYPYYYIVVQSADPFGGTGRYTLSASFTPTDDHPDGDPNRDNVFDTGEFALATPLALDPLSGQGSQTGVIEVLDDDDLFTMIVPASGTVTLSVANDTALGSTIRPRITIMDVNANILAQDIGADVALSIASVTLTASRGQRLYVVVDGFNDPDAPNFFGTNTGAYTINYQAPPVDDHANATEWNIATSIAINTVTGKGQVGGNAGNDLGNARINPSGDTDLFTFTVIRTGEHTVTITPFISDFGSLATRVRLYSSTNLVTPIADQSSSAVAGAVTFDLGTVNIGATFFILVEAAPLFGATDFGEFNVVVQGPAGGGGGGGGGGNDASAIDFNSPTVILLNARDGNGTSGKTTNSQSPEITPATDRDLYSFTTIAPGVVFVRISTPTGSLLDASVEVLKRNANNPNQFDRVAFDQDGIAGSTAALSFPSAAGIEYFILVDGLGDSTGSYLVEVDTQPAVNRLVFPEGFATNIISEFVPIVNPNPFPIEYTVRLRYDSGSLETVFPARTIGANLRDGVTITRPEGSGTYSDFTVRQNVAYSVIIEWTIPNVYNGQPVDPATIQPLGATMSHYDFGRSTGDAFTDKVSPTWAFARVERDPGAVFDFFPVYNPHSFDIGMYLDVYMNDGTVITVGDTDSNGLLAPRRVGAGRRSGFGLDDYAQLGRGVFSAVIRAAAFNPSDQPSFEGIVASLTHYRINQSAFAVLGDASGGVTKGAVTNLTAGSGITSELTFFNPGTSPATVTITGSYVNASLPQFTRVVTLQPGRTTRISGSSLGVVSGQTVGLKYSSNVPVYQLAFQERLGDADASTAQTAAGTRAYFGDAFINADSAGRLYFEWLNFYNPTGVTNNVTITLRFFNRVGEADQTRTINVSIPAGGFAEVRLHERNEVLRRANGDSSGAAFFGIEASSVQPFVSTLTHYDLFLGGGWGAAGVPFGIATPLTSI